MQKKSSRFVTFIKKHKILAILSGATVAILAVWSATNFIPRPLGDQMEYLGKKDYGNIFGFDSKPHSIYYYGTALNANDLVGYFKKSTLLQKPFSENGKETVNIQTPSGESIYIYHYSSSELSSFNTTKPYVIEIPSFKYQAALDSL